MGTFEPELSESVDTREGDGEKQHLITLQGPRSALLDQGKTTGL